MSAPELNLRIVEALLFASPESVTEEAIAERLPSETDVPALLAELVAHYDGRGVAPTKIGGRWSFRTAEDLGPRLKIKVKRTRRLSRAGLETLAIVAYHQPITRAEIEEIRGVGLSRGTIDLLLEIGWIRPSGRRRTPGRPLQWRTTDEFLQHFGLESLDDLPGREEMKAAGLLDARPDPPPVGRLKDHEDALVGSDDEDEEDDEA
jgi:segregation and condensation protein B